jgi:hypothetical protein
VVGRLPEVDVAEAEVGQRTISVEHPGYVSATCSVVIERSTRRRCDVALQEKRARLRVEAQGLVNGVAQPVEAQLFVDGVDVGPTPWKGVMRAEVEHHLALRLGSAEHSYGPVRVDEGAEALVTIEVPTSWTGASSTLQLRGDTSVVGRAGDLVARPDEPVALRPGASRLELEVEGLRLGVLDVVLQPGRTHTVEIVERPRTSTELASAVDAWEQRRWVAAGGAAAGALTVAAALGGAYAATSTRDDAYAGLRAAVVPEEQDGFRQSVIDAETTRTSWLTVAAIGTVVVGTGLAWSALEWLVMEPTRGHWAVEGGTVREEE